MLISATLIARCYTSELLHFMNSNSLVAKDLDFDGIQFTYESDDGTHRSWVDHVLVSPRLLPRICEITVVSSGANLSDHRPICVMLDCAQTHPHASVPPVRSSSNKVAWHRATPAQIQSYQSLVDECCCAIEIPADVISCTVPNCSVHKGDLEHLCLQLSSCLIRCADCSIPKRGGKHLAGWNDEVKSLKENSVLWNRIWQEAGCPSVGVLSQLRKHTKSRYKYAVRRLIRNQDKLRRKKMADAMVEGGFRDFWQLVNHCKANSKNQASCIDGVSDDAEIADLWASKFKSLLTSPDPDAHRQLAEALSSLKISPEELKATMVTPEILLNSLQKLKRGKADGGGLMSDHLIFAPSSFLNVLASVLTALLRHGHMPSCFSDALIQPIPKGNNKDYSLSSNYRGIALASCFSKVIELCILELHGQRLLSSQLQFGFKPGLSTTMCTGVLKAVVSRYLHGGSNVYGCLIDASKAFDTVDHTILLDKLLARDLPAPVLRFLFGWYISQRLRVNWNGHNSEPFEVSRGVRQGGVLSPILFTLYIDDLLTELSHTNVGCYWDKMFAGAIAYADDITLLAPTPSALRKLLAVCETSGSSLKLKFNPEKTQCIRFGLRSSEVCNTFKFCGKSIKCEKAVTHLGHILTENLRDDLDIKRCRADFIKRANCTLHRFSFCTPEVLSYLLRCYCMSFYGCAIWDLSSPLIKCIDVCMNKVLRRVWSLPYNCHTGIIHVVSDCCSVFNVCYNRFCKLLLTAKCSCNRLVREVFVSSSFSCRNYIGYNNKYGFSCVRNYSCTDKSIARLIREIRNRSLYVPGFDCCSLNCIVRVASSL